MVRSFGVSDNEVAKWVGLTSAIFSVCQGLTAVAWGAASDRIGRRPIIISGLCITMTFSLMFGFSTSLPMAILARACVGLGNGNVGIIRTVVAELVPEKELQPRAFSIMPLVWTIGSIFGPGFGGALANPARRHKEQFGDSTFFKKYPYALPNMAVSVFFIIGIFTGLLFLQVRVSPLPFLLGSLPGDMVDTYLLELGNPRIEKGPSGLGLSFGENTHKAFREAKGAEDPAWHLGQRGR